MKLSEAIAPRIMNSQQAAFHVGGEANLKRLLKAGWLKPIPGKQRGVDYDRKALELAADRLTLEGWPDDHNFSMSESEAIK